MLSTRVSAWSFDELNANAHITIDGQIPTPGECDDPVVELFRPIRYQCVNDVFFTIIVTHKTDCIACTIIPSNRRNRAQEELNRVTKKALLGDSSHKGVLTQYIDILEKFFRDDEGLKLFLEKAEEVTRAEGAERSSLCIECNEIIKMFVRKNNLEMPSLRKRKEALLKQNKLDSAIIQ
ncbi:hypothetical protein IJI28_01155 [Candidatus Saccharibacteria bacterium]|nr:hypothetical protein [Candidatus Saccharibacteria bacterium]